MEDLPRKSSRLEASVVRVSSCDGMQLFAFAPLPVGVLPWNDPDPCVTVITKLTLSYDRAGFAVADEQEPLCRALPSLFGSAEELHHPDDFVPRKARCDLLLSGSAYASMALPAIVARLSVGAFQKRFVALAGEATTAIPLAAAYLRRKRVVDAEPVTVGALSSEHPERAPFKPFGDLDAAALRRTALPRDFDFSYFNAAPRDQQIAPVAAGTTLSLEGLSPDGVPASGQLPLQWPQIYALSREGNLVEIALTCDTVWIDTDRNICELSLRGTWRAAAKSREQALPMGLAVRLRDTAQRQGPLLLADLPAATKSRALYAEEAVHAVAQVDSIEEIDAESFITEDTTSGKIVDEETAAMPAAEGPALPALGRLGAMQLQHERPAEMPALPRDPRKADSSAPEQARPRRPITLTMTAPPALGQALPFSGRSAALAAWDALASSRSMPVPQPQPQSQPQSSADGAFRRPRTLEILPGALDQAVLPFLGANKPQAAPTSAPPSQPIGPFVAPAPPSRPTAPTFAAVPLSQPSMPFVAPAPSSPPSAPTFAAAPLSQPVVPFVAPAPPSQPSAPSFAAAPLSQPVVPFVAPAPPSQPSAPSFAAPPLAQPSMPFVAPAPPSQPSAPSFAAAPLARSPLLELPDVAPPRRTIGESMIGATPPPVRSEPALALTAPLAEPAIALETYAAVKVEIWGDREPVAPVLLRHGIDEVAWYENERRLAEALAREAREGGTRLATSLQQALRTARDERPVDLERPLRAFEDTYVKLLAAIDLAEDPSAVIASKGVTAAEWRNIRRRFLARAEADAAARDALAVKLAAARKAAGDDGSPTAEPKRWVRSEPAPPGVKRVASRKPS